MDPTGLIISGSIGLLLDAVLLGKILSTLRQTRIARNWPATIGTVLISTLTWHRPSVDSSPSQYPVVKYSYQVGSRAFQNDRIAAGMAVGGPGAKKVNARYTTGSQVKVYYNPDDPVDSVLEVKTPASIVVLWIFIAAVTAFLIGLPAVEYLLG